MLIVEKDQFQRSLWAVTWQTAPGNLMQSGRARRCWCLFTGGG